MKNSKPNKKFIGFEYDFNENLDIHEVSNLNQIIDLVQSDYHFDFCVQRNGKWITMFITITVKGDGSKTITCDKNYLTEMDLPRWKEMSEEDITTLWENPKFKPTPSLLQRMQELGMQLPDGYNHRKW